MRKYFNLPFFSLAIIFSILAGLETPFNTITYSYIFKLITDKNIGMIVPAVIFIVFGYAIFCLLNYLKSIVVNKNIILINNRLKKDYMFAKMSSVTADENDFESKNVSFVLNDLKLLEDNYWRQIFMLLGSVAMTLGTLIYALYSNVLVTLIFLGFMIFPTLAPKFFSHAIQDKTTSWSKSNQVLSGTVQNLLHGALLLRRYHATSGFSERLDESVSKMEQANANLKNQISLTNNVISFLFSLCTYLPIGIGIYFTITGKLTLSQFVAIQYSSSWILNGFNQIVTSWNTINSTKDIRQQVANLHIQVDHTDTTSVVRDLDVEQISFDFKGKTIFQNVSFDVKRGQKILIGGKSGVGKSTLIRLLLKELLPKRGKILLNGKNYLLNQAYSSFGIVGQTPIIFEDTLRNNVTLGKSATDAEVFRALDLAGLNEFSNESAIKQVIDENGHNYSGGQLKRIEIARALFYNRQILLIDEGTASLDPQTAKGIHQSLLTNPDLTVIEVDHHIPDDIKKLYDQVYQLNAEGMQML